MKYHNVVVSRQIINCDTICDAETQPGGDEESRMQAYRARIISLYGLRQSDSLKLESTCRGEGRVDMQKPRADKSLFVSDFDATGDDSSQLSRLRHWQTPRRGSAMVLMECVYACRV